MFPVDLVDIWAATGFLALIYAYLVDWRTSLIWVMFAPHLSASMWWFSVFLLAAGAVLKMIGVTPKG